MRPTIPSRTYFVATNIKQYTRENRNRNIISRTHLWSRVEANSTENLRGVSVRGGCLSFDLSSVVPVAAMNVISLLKVMHAVNTFIGSEMISRVDLLPSRTPERCIYPGGGNGSSLSSAPRCLSAPLTQKESILFAGLLTMMAIKAWLFYEMISVEQQAAATAAAAAAQKDSLRIHVPQEGTKTHIWKKSKSVLSLVQSLVIFVEKLSHLEFW